MGLACHIDYGIQVEPDLQDSARNRADQPHIRSLLFTAAPTSRLRPLGSGDETILSERRFIYPFGRQYLAFTTDTPAILLLRCWLFDHCTYARFASLEGKERRAFHHRSYRFWLGDCDETLR